MTGRTHKAHTHVIDKNKREDGTSAVKSLAGAKRQFGPPGQKTQQVLLHVAGHQREQGDEFDDGFAAPQRCVVNLTARRLLQSVSDTKKTFQI
jgi:hypothetical protein